MPKLYDLVKDILEVSEPARNSDKECIWQVYTQLGIVKTVEAFGPRQAILKENFLSKGSPSFESITRCRRRIQEVHEHLQSTNKEVRVRRKKKADTKGIFMYHEKTKERLNAPVFQEATNKKS